MNNRELLELAAIAIGERVLCSEAEIHCIPDESTIYTGVMLEGVRDVWNPLADDGDALRLAMNLCIDVRRITRERLVAAKVHFSIKNKPLVLECKFPYVEFKCDYMPAARRSIVGAAAALGKAQQALYD